MTKVKSVVYLNYKKNNYENRNKTINQKCSIRLIMFSVIINIISNYFNISNFIIMKTQLEQIQKHLKGKKKITSWEAIEKYRITRLAHYIYVLRSMGWDIESKKVMKNGKNFVKYEYRN